MVLDYDRDALDPRSIYRLAELMWDRGPEVWSNFQDVIAAFAVDHGTDLLEYYVDSAVNVGMHADSMGVDDELTADIQRLYRFLGSVTQ